MNKNLMLVVASVTTLVACGTETLDHGTVVDKTHREAYDDFIPIYTSCGNNCMMMIPTLVHHDEEWALYLRDGDKTGEALVGPTTWNLFQNGMSYP
jgi:hypothetical protein